jgi:hypothetical protein
MAKVLTDNDTDAILPPELPTIPMSGSARSVVTRNGLWIMALSDDNRFFCYNWKNRAYSTLTTAQPYYEPTNLFPRPDRLLSLYNGSVLMISWHRDDQPVGKGPFQLLDPQTSTIHYFGGAGVGLPIKGLKNCDVAIIDCDHTSNDEQYIIIGNGGIEHFDNYGINRKFWCATISPSISPPGPRIDQWREFDIASSIPSTLNGISLRDVLD